MVAAQPPFPIEPVAEEQRLVVSGVPWETYVMLREGLDHTNLRMTYLEGTLEIMSPSRRHAGWKPTSATRVARRSCPRSRSR